MAITGTAVKALDQSLKGFWHFKSSFHVFQHNPESVGGSSLSVCMHTLIRILGNIKVDGAGMR